MTQLIIDGIEAVLSESFNVTVKRENSIITKNGEYTYDCVLKLDNATNRQLYGFLHRLNKKGEVTTKRSAVLIADGHVYCRGTEIITGWTDKEVNVQIVSGNSELNYFIGGELMIEELTDMGEIEGNLGTLFIAPNNPTSDDLDWTLPTIVDSANGNIYNQWLPNATDANKWPTLLGGGASGDGTTLRAQPYLCALITRIITALGYTITINQLLDTTFKNVFLVNTINTKKFYEMLPGWTAKEFLEEVEKFCNCVFTVDNVKKTCGIYVKSNFYQGARIVPLYKITDEYQAEVVDPEPEHATSDLVYQLEDGDLQRLQDCENMLGELTVIECSSFSDVLTQLSYVGVSDKKIALDTSTNRYYIRINDPLESDDQSLANVKFIAEVNNFAPLRRNPSDIEEVNELEMGIVPVPMVCGALRNSAWYMEVAVVGTGEQFVQSGNGFGGHGTGTFGANDDEPMENDSTVEELIKAGKSEEKTNKIQLYAAIYNGYHQERNGWMPSAYTDAHHAEHVAGLRYAKPWSYSESPRWYDIYEGSLRFIDLDNEIYQGLYYIDTKKSVTFTTFDKMVANPRQVLNIHNKLWVIREIEETFTAYGRKPSWKLTCHPINITATQEQIEWVLEDGTWNDKNVWFDLGKWNDEPTQEE